MEVARTTDVLYLDAFAATHRRALLALKRALFVVTALSLASFLLWSWLTVRRWQQWTDFHTEAYAAVQSALDGNVEAELPPSAPIDLHHLHMYSDLLKLAKEKVACDKRRPVVADSMLDSLEKIAGRIKSEDYKALSKDYARLQELSDDLREIDEGSFKMYLLESCSKDIRLEWDLKWPKHHLEFPLLATADQQDQEFVKRASELHAQINADRQFEEGKVVKLWDIWDSSTELPKADSPEAREFAIDALSSVVMELETRLDFQYYGVGILRNLLQEPSQSQSPNDNAPQPYEHPLGPGITLL